MRSITARSLITTMNFMRPPHPSHFSASTPHTRCSSVAWSHVVSSTRWTAAIPADHALAAPSAHSATAPL
jgi:hypothetical protein